jgi:glycosyltransferase involved in cell wall biosynthesis
MNVCVITSMHGAYDVRIFQKQCKSLVSRGYRVTLIAPHDREEVKDDVRIIPFKKSKNKFTRIYNAVFTLFWMALRESSNVYHLHDPDLLITGALLKLVGKKVIVDVHEYYPKYVMEAASIPYGIRKILSRMIAIYQRVLTYPVDQVVTITEKMAEEYRVGWTTVIHNYPIDFGCRPASDQKVGVSSDDSDNKVKLLFTGMVCQKWGIEYILKALENLNDDRVQLVIVGWFMNDEYREKIINMSGWRYVDFIGKLTHREVQEVMKSADIGMAYCTAVDNHYYAEPNKLFEYMASGLPVICSDMPGIRSVVDYADGGVCVKPECVSSMMESIEYLSKNESARCSMGERARRSVEQKFNWKSEEVKLFAMYEKVLTKR